MSIGTMELKHYKYWRGILFILLWIVACSTSNERLAESFRAKSIDYSYRISQFPTDSPDSTKLRFDFSIPYNHLVFVAQDSEYKAGIRFGLFVLTKQHDLVYEKTWDRNIQVDSYAATKEKELVCRFSASTSLRAGKYQVTIEAQDKNVAVPKYIERQLEVKDQSDKRIAVGDILLWHGKRDFSQKSDSLTFPKTNPICRDDFTLSSIAYVQKPIKPIQRLSARAIWMRKNQKVRSDPVNVVQDGQKLLLYRAYAIKEIPQDQFRVRFELSVENYDAETNWIDIEIVKEISFLDEISLDRAIDQMVYIGEGALWDSLKNAETIEQKRYWFRRYWEENYPTNDSLRHPLREEYFRRVRYVNREFGNISDGWRTDRGRTYIIYGPPDEIQRSMDGQMREMVIWVYHELAKRFVFLDAQGTGEFRLVQIY